MASSDMAGPEGLPLRDCVVIDLGTGIAGAYCTKLLCDGGAEVIKVEPPEGDPLRRWSASGAEIDDDGALFSFLSGGKSSVVADPDDPADLELVSALLDSADVVVWSPGSRLTDHPRLSAAAIRRAHRHLVVTAITPFGLDGPWRDRPATEFTLQAWSGGIVGLGRGAPDQAPVYVGGRIGEWFAGAHASAATMTSRLRTRGSSAGELVDLSMLETQILGLTYFPVSFFDALGRPFRTERKLSVPGVATAADGMVALGCGTAQQWFDLCAMVGHPEWIDEGTAPSITARATEKAPEIFAWLAGQPAEVIRDLATAFRIPNGPVVHGANATEMDHHVARKAFTVNPRDGFHQPGPPYRTRPALLAEPRPAPRLGEHTGRYRAARPTRRGALPRVAPDPLPFRELRVLDLTTYWAGPSCTHFLAMLGAEVIHVESAGRPDGTRLIAGVPVSEDQWWEKSPIFSGLNTNKKGLTLDFRSERGRELLRRLAATCDVIVENYTPRVLEQIGLDYPDVRALRPDTIMVRMPGFGLDGPWRDNPAFAYIIEDTSGLTWLTGHKDRNPLEPYSIGDPNAGVHALNGLLLALENRRRTGHGALVEAAMVDAALNVAAEQVIEYSAYGALLERDGNRGPEAAPQNLYRAAGTDEFGREDRWVAIAVATDTQWRKLREVLDEPFWAMTPELRSAEGRRLHHDLIDEHLAVWCATRTPDEIVQTLWDAGVPVAEVMQPHRQADLPQLQSRGFFEPVDHPVAATARHSTVPARFSAGPHSFHRTPAPLLGQHNREILTGLGLTEPEISELEAEGVIGGSPAVAAP
ncbi:crotonobetainyl-CoA:carnitine CoA-transferase CaiB-like acyl-CoA transferase [Nocardia transvalensis]|uniref:Crotonobetainyl-CoA:carnitine CoA-transferase CaiB-like acyl-CoA transferase n=1 Tax=Nocardia transvalensis TaxID=37333 RepID=A0A7W9PG73_9NOCA|nr:CoA transferase [Nocardia transvalensis]MBB5915485.1 crotonobetainyl-CoA:carnitine CoA-transferase CaiB-like acyl-CoA transferase [Nocardia transvalensis]